jgi:hypothetical protein
LLPFGPSPSPHPWGVYQQGESAGGISRGGREASLLLKSGGAKLLFLPTLISFYIIKGRLLLFFDFSFLLIKR